MKFIYLVFSSADSLVSACLSEKKAREIVSGVVAGYIVKTQAGADYLPLRID